MLGRAAIVLALIGCQDKTPAPKPKPSVAGDAALAVPDAAVKKSLAEELEAIRTEHQLPALAAAVWRDGKPVELEAVGLRKADDPASKVTAKDYWHLGSNTKAMTALLIAIHVDRGALKWDDTLDKWFKKIDPGYA